MKLVVMIPALNEAATVAGVILGVPRQMSGVREIEVVVIDDGSTDATATEARSAGAHVVSHGRNRGLGIAFRTGLSTALARGADIIVNLDADGQFNPADIPTLIRPVAENHADIVTTTRFKDPTLIPEMPPIKLWGNRMVTRMVNWTTGQRFTDVSCGFRALSREAALRLTLFGGFTYTHEMLIDAAQKELRIVEIPLRVRGERQHGSSRVYAGAWNYAARSLAILFRQFRDSNPLQVFGIAASFVGGAGVLAGLFVLQHWLRTGQTFPYRSLVIVSGVLLLLSAFFATVALLADMLKRQRRVLEEMLYHQRKATYGTRRE